MKNFIIIAIVVVIVAIAAGYVYRAKKSGRKCIGCPNACACTNKNKKLRVGNNYMDLLQRGSIFAASHIFINDSC